MSYDTDQKLELMFAMQAKMQEENFGADITKFEFVMDQVAFFKDMHIALTDELHEALGEMSWKPWQTAEYFNTEAVKGELIDAWHFFMNLWLAAGGTPQELFDRYQLKHDKNIKRQEEGYDGVSTKCPRCKRALDDDAVTCEMADDGRSGVCRKGMFDEDWTVVL